MPRFAVPNVPLHLIQRGNNRQAMFLAPRDHLVFLDLIEQRARRHAVAVHAYILMPNHVHLVVTPTSEEGVPRTMQAVGTLYVRWFNDRYHRTGSLWEGRYRASIVEDERYLLTCMRYVELNAVRAGIVRRPEAFRWSSYRANALGRRDELVTPHPLYLALGKTRDVRTAAYRDLVKGGMQDEELALIRDATHHAWAVGGERFRAAVDSSGRRAQRLPRGRRPKPS